VPTAHSQTRCTEAPHTKNGISRNRMQPTVDSMIRLWEPSPSLPLVFTITATTVTFVKLTTLLVAPEVPSLRTEATTTVTADHRCLGVTCPPIKKYLFRLIKTRTTSKPRLEATLSMELPITDIKSAALSAASPPASSMKLPELLQALVALKLNSVWIGSISTALERSFRLREHLKKQNKLLANV